MATPLDFVRVLPVLIERSVGQPKPSISRVLPGILIYYKFHTLESQLMKDLSFTKKYEKLRIFERVIYIDLMKIRCLRWLQDSKHQTPYFFYIKAITRDS